jgi:uncharacterized protein (TIGR00106 family)
MSVVMNFAMFPTERTGSASPYVSRVVEKVRESGFENQLTAMGTIVETENLSEALGLIDVAYKTLEADCERVYVTISLDIKKGSKGRLKSKVQSVHSIIGK